MNVVLLGLGWPPGRIGGGLDRYLEALHRSLRSQGVSAVAIVTGGSEIEHSGVVASGPASNPLPVRILRFAFAARHQARNADLVDVHFAPYAWLPIHLGGLRGKPTVVHFHGPWADESCASGLDGRVKVALKRLIEGSVYRRAESIVTLSGAFRDVLIAEYGVLPWRVSVISPGVDVERFSPTVGSGTLPESGLKTVLAVRRLVPRMGLDLLIEAVAELCRTDRSLQLEIAGAGPDRAPLERLVAERGLGDHVRFLGLISDADLVSAYRRADVAVVPSLAHEGFGLVALEALACGVPVIATKVGGLPEALAPLQQNLIVPPGDVSALVGRLRTALDGSLPLPSRKACRAYAETFSWERSAQRNLAVFRRACDRTVSGRPRVVIIDHCARLSGAEIGLLRLLPALSSVEVHVILAEDGPLVGQLRQAGVSVEILLLTADVTDLPRASVTGRKLPWGLAVGAGTYAAQLARHLRFLRPDVIHTYSLKAGIYGGLAAKATKAPVIWQIHDRISEDYLPSAAVRLVRRSLPHLANRAVVSSRTVLDTLEVRSLPVSIVPYALPDHAYRTEPILLRAGVSGLRVGMVGRISPWKGQAVFVEAFARAFSDTTAKAIIVGSALFGEEGEIERLEALIGRLGVGSQVEMLGFRHDVAAELASLDILVHASTIPEPFGQVVTEGMAAGIPVVASAAGGPSEIITHDRDGLLYPPGDVTALAGCLKRLAENPADRLRIGREARASAERYRVEPLARMMEDIYLGAAGGRATS